MGQDRGLSIAGVEVGPVDNSGPGVSRAVGRPTTTRDLVSIRRETAALQVAMDACGASDARVARAWSTDEKIVEKVRLGILPLSDEKIELLPDDVYEAYVAGMNARRAARKARAEKAPRADACDAVLALSKAAAEVQDAYRRARAESSPSGRLITRDELAEIEGKLLALCEAGSEVPVSVRLEMTGT